MPRQLIGTDFAFLIVQHELPCISVSILPCLVEVFKVLLTNTVRKPGCKGKRKVGVSARKSLLKKILVISLKIEEALLVGQGTVWTIFIISSVTIWAYLLNHCRFALPWLFLVRLTRRLRCVLTQVFFWFRIDSFWVLVQVKDNFVSFRIVILCLFLLHRAEPDYFITWVLFLLRAFSLKLRNELFKNRKLFHIDVLSDIFKKAWVQSCHFNVRKLSHHSVLYHHTQFWNIFSIFCHDRNTKYYLITSD